MKQSQKIGGCEELLLNGEIIEQERQDVSCDDRPVTLETWVRKHYGFMLSELSEHSLDPYFDPTQYLADLGIDQRFRDLKEEAERLSDALLNECSAIREERPDITDEELGEATEELAQRRHRVYSLLSELRGRAPYHRLRNEEEKKLDAAKQRDGFNNEFWGSVYDISVAFESPYDGSMFTEEYRKRPGWLLDQLDGVWEQSFIGYDGDVYKWFNSRSLKGIYDGYDLYACTTGAEHFRIDVDTIEFEDGDTWE